MILKQVKLSVFIIIYHHGNNYDKYTTFIVIINILYIDKWKITFAWICVYISIDVLIDVTSQIFTNIPKCKNIN